MDEARTILLDYALVKRDNAKYPKHRQLLYIECSMELGDLASPISGERP